jgi:hypothetical protein
MQNNKINPSSGQSNAHQSKRAIQKELINARLTISKLQGELKNHQLFTRSQKSKELDLCDKSIINLKTIKEALFFTASSLVENKHNLNEYTASVLNLIIDKVETQERVNESYFYGKFGGRK